MSQQVLSIDFDITKESELGADDLECIFIPLETKEECLLSLSFDDIQFYDDKIFIVNSQNNMARVFVFSKEGDFITQIGKIGQGPGEYSQPYKLHINENKKIITIADRHLNKLIDYNLDSYKYISNKPIPFNYTQCIWLSDEQILWYSDGGLDTGKREWYYAWITDKEMDITTTFGKTKPFNYLVGNTTVYKYRDQAYIGIPFSPYIYQMDTTNTTPVWKVSFGKQELPPESLVVDERENNIAWTNRVIQSGYVYTFQVFETSDWLGISFLDRQFHMGFYDKKNKTTHAYTIKKFMENFHLYGVYDIINTYNDYFVTRIASQDLMKQNQQRENLRLIAENMTEEDNPVLCLFKLK
mgnify:CR=1 FL=1